MYTAVRYKHLPLRFTHLFLSDSSHSCPIICADCPTSALTLQYGVWASANDCVGWATTMY